MGYQGIRANRSCVDLVGHQVAKFEHINIADHNLLIELLTGASIKERRFSIFIDPGESLHLTGFGQILSNLRFLDSIEHRCSHLKSECLGSDTKVSFQNLTHIHAARHPQGIENNFDRSAVAQKRHIFFRNDLGNHALVPVSSGHLIANTELPLTGDIDLDLLNDSWVDIIATLDPIKRAILLQVELSELVFEGADDL